MFWWKQVATLYDEVDDLRNEKTGKTLKREAVGDSTGITLYCANGSFDSFDMCVCSTLVEAYRQDVLLKAFELSITL